MILKLTLILTSFLNPAIFAGSSGMNRACVNDTTDIIEKVYLHIDRDRYNAGDDIWFKAYLVDGSDQLSDNSFNLHVELISPNQNIIDSRTVRLLNGLGNGDFKLSEKLHSGLYNLRAYTNYMRNSDNRYFFNKEVMIINPADSGKMVRDSISYVRNKIETDFFPEGGSLVDDVSSVVAFKATDAAGKGFDVNGKIYSSSGELIAEVKSTHKGMGKFSLTPAQGKTYFAIFYNHSGDTIRKELPKSFPEGLVLSLSDNSEGFIDLTIRTNSKTLQQFTGHDLFLTVSARNTEYKIVSFRMKTINSIMNFTSEDIPDGIVKITISGPDDKPLCERLIFVRNKEDVDVHLETDKSLYNQRDSLSLKLSLSVSSGVGGNAWLSLAAVENISLADPSGYPSTISSWFLLESDVRGTVEDPGYYFDPTNTDRLKNLDLLLLTQGWRDFSWKYDRTKYQPEYGFALSGRARKKFSDAPVRNSYINIGIFKTGKPMIKAVPVDSAGRFLLKGVDINGNARLIASITNDKEKLNGWLILDSMNYIPAPVQIIGKRKELLYSENGADGSNRMGKSFTSYIQYSEFRRSVQKKYKLSDTINVGEVTITARLQIKPESPQDRSQRYLMTRWPDKEYKIEPKTEIYNNIGLLLRSKFRLFNGDDPRDVSLLPGGTFHESAMTYEGNKGKDGGGEQSARLTVAASKNAPGFISSAKGSPIFLLDGMQVDWETVKSLPVSWVERVDMLDPRHGELIWGDRGKDGVISVITKPWSEQPDMLYNSVNVKIRGYDEPRIFYSPKHHTSLEKDYKPDLRTTLFWEPNIVLEENREVVLNYFNADNPSTVRIIVEGITATGIPVTGTAEYEVK